MTLSSNDRRHDFLLISRVGGDSLHHQWMAPEGGRGFDLLLSAYDRGVDPVRGDGVFFEDRPGRKVAGYSHILRDHEALIRGYKYVALFDDDLGIDSRSVTRLFEICAAHDLRIAQPSLTHDSHFTYAALLRDASFSLRYINFIEMMCPVFRVDALFEARDLFGLGYESGIDLVWSNLGQPDARALAVIDEIAVRHVRPVGALKEANGFGGGRRYEDDIYAVLERFGLPWLSCVPYGGLRTDGRFVRARLAFILSALKLVNAIPRGADPAGRARKVAVHWKHLLHSKARNIPVKLSSSEQAGTR